jgi:hypothetical protein
MATGAIRDREEKRTFLFFKLHIIFPPSRDDSHALYVAVGLQMSSGCQNLVKAERCSNDIRAAAFHIQRGGGQGECDSFRAGAEKSAPHTASTLKASKKQ